MKLIIGLLAVILFTAVFAVALVVTTVLNALFLAPVSAIMWFTWNHSPGAAWHTVEFLPVWYGVMFLVALREVVRKGSGIDEFFKQLAENRKAK